MTVNLQNLINIGNVVNDGLGDDLRTAFEKVNSAFQITVSSGININGNDGGVYKDVVGNSLRFKNIVAGEGIGIITNDTSVIIQNNVAETLVNGENIGGSIGGIFAGKDGPIFQFKNIIAGTGMAINESPISLELINYSFNSITTDSGNILATDDQDISIVGSDNISVTASDNIITIDTTIPIKEILTSFDFGTLSGIYSNPISLALAFTSIDFGTIDYPSSIDFDLGTIG